MCTLRVFGEGFDPEDFLVGSALKADAVFKRGEPHGVLHPEGGARYSGMNVGVSDADWSDVGEQVADALAFLTQHRAELEQLRSLLGDGGLVLDFGLDVDVGRSKWAQSVRFPAALVRLAGEIGVELELSLYPADEDDDHDSEVEAPN